MKKIVLVILFLGFCINAKAQWVLDYQFNPANSEHVRTLSVVDTNTLWILTRNSSDTGIISRKIGLSVTTLNSNGFFRPGELIAIDFSRAYISSDYQKLYYTSNSGSNWSTRIDTGVSFPLYFCTAHNAPNNICAVYESNSFQAEFLKSTDNGASWVLQDLNLPTDHFISGISMTDPQHIYVGVNCQAGSCPEVRYVYTTNGGTNWLTKTFPQVSYNTTIYAPVFDQQNQFGFTFAWGYYIYRYRTTNGGQNWSAPEYFSLGNTEGVSGIKNIDSTPVWLCAKARNIYVSGNNGANWYEMSIALDDSDAVTCLDAIRSGNKYYAYVGTSRGKIYKVLQDISAIGIQQISNEIPKSFSLSQNYPNPFNPSTKIKFDIPLSGGVQGQFTQLKIYDITGRQIAVLVNESLSSGTYEVTWDASAYSSGVYFYEITASDFRQVRKMVVMK